MIAQIAKCGVDGVFGAQIALAARADQGGQRFFGRHQKLQRVHIRRSDHRLRHPDRVFFLRPGAQQMHQTLRQQPKALAQRLHLGLGATTRKGCRIKPKAPEEGARSSAGLLSWLAAAGGGEEGAQACGAICAAGGARIIRHRRRQAPRRVPAVLRWSGASPPAATGSPKPKSKFDRDAGGGDLRGRCCNRVQGEWIVERAAVPPAAAARGAAKGAGPPSKGCGRLSGRGGGGAAGRGVKKSSASKPSGRGAAPAEAGAR